MFAKKLDIFTQNPLNTVSLTITLKAYHRNALGKPIPYLKTLGNFFPILMSS